MSEWNPMAITNNDGLNWKCVFYLFIFLEGDKKIMQGFKKYAAVPEKQFIFLFGLMHSYLEALCILSLGSVVNILAIFSNANILKNKRIKRYHIKGIGCPLLISINIDAWGHR